MPLFTIQDPALFQMGLGMMAGNYGTNNAEIFANAARGAGRGYSAGQRSALMQQEQDLKEDAYQERRARMDELRERMRGDQENAPVPPVASIPMNPAMQPDTGAQTFPAMPPPSIPAMQPMAAGAPQSPTTAIGPGPAPMMPPQGTSQTPYAQAPQNQQAGPIDMPQITIPPAPVPQMQPPMPGAPAPTLGIPPVQQQEPMYGGYTGQEWNQMASLADNPWQAMMQAQAIQAPTEVSAPKTIKGADGFNYYITGPEKGQRVLPDVQGKPAALDVKGESAFRKEWTNINKDFRKVDAAFSRITASADKPSAAGDLSLIFNYMKMLDPGSTVREGEFATAQNAAGVDGRVRARLNGLLSGERLTPEQRADFLGRSGMLYNKSHAKYNKRKNAFSGMASAYGYDVGRSVIDFASEKPEESPTPAAQAAPPTPTKKELQQSNASRASKRGWSL